MKLAISFLVALMLVISVQSDGNSGDDPTLSFKCSLPGTKHGVCIATADTFTYTVVTTTRTANGIYSCKNVNVGKTPATGERCCPHNFVAKNQVKTTDSDTLTMKCTAPDAH
ncbi:uncharacterized protein PGTG_19808 [Puccinia graminis f. sp. tritici CRL 75-36-700-3]|uniref:Uncharacterized protein n=1 Tax=Puccinia graminis f. sp. tritici (strain CRL 75-36-700-3 / race SCCL) TaxID=418459 RepID=E3LB56_PUCGT|nr:uncharacterized protein PGTG_19808 [Puccinia graminis f. sp. tritici CRL 75-36-700-3]EFP93781.1 hypothetical protein PGTG_19808 [Puccinia graminis f. sp. tritici CRL 75-36-700-3]